MNKFAAIAGLAAASVAMTASADTLLSVDLSVTNEVTITGLGGLSSASVSGSAFTGALMADFFTGAGGTGFLDTAGIGNLTTANDVADGSPGIFNSAGNFGFNIWSYSTTSSVTAGQVAFSGSGTWAVDATVYASMLAGNLSGDVYFSADTDDDIPFSTNIGTWEVKVPAPSSLALLGLGGIVAGRRRR